MSIYSSALKNKILSAASYDELADVYSQNFNLMYNYSEELRQKIAELPAAYSEYFFNVITQFLQTKENYSADTDYSINLRVSILREYCKKLVEAKVLLHDRVPDDYIPIIVYSALLNANTEIVKTINDHYLIYAIMNLSDCMGDISNVTIVKLANAVQTHDYEEVLTQFPNIATELINVLTSESAYEDWLINYLAYLKAFDLESIILKESSLIKLYIKDRATAMEWENIATEDIYNLICYVLATFDVCERDSSFDLMNLKKHQVNMILNCAPLLWNACTMSKVADASLERYLEDKHDFLSKIIERAFYIYIYTHAQNNIFLSQSTIYESVRKYLADICKDCIERNDVFYYEKDKNISPESAMEKMDGYDKNSSMMDKASRKIYNGYKAYKDAENKVDSQLSKLASRIKNIFTGEQTARDRVIEGKKFSAVKIIKNIFTTAAIFSYSKVAGILFILTRHFCSKKVDSRERKKVISELELEIKMLDEKIEDARGDGNRQAKYNMMRTRAELQKAVEQIKYGFAADKKSMDTAKAVASGAQSTEYNPPPSNDED